MADGISTFIVYALHLSVMKLLLFQEKFIFRPRGWARRTPADGAEREKVMIKNACRGKHRHVVCTLLSFRRKELLLDVSLGCRLSAQRRKDQLDVD